MGTLKKILGTLCISALLVSASNASWLSDFVENNFGTSITSESAGYYKSQASGFYSAGGFRARWGGNSSLRPFSVQAPSFNVGCNGIDMVFGSFSYLNFDNLIQKLKKMSSAAPAFAFQIALSTLCKDCQTILDELTALADMMNSISFDSCQMMTNWANKIGNSLSDNQINGMTESWISSAKNVTQGIRGEMDKYIGSVNRTVSGNDDSGESNSNKLFEQGSLVQKFTESNKIENFLKSAFIGSNKEKDFEGLMRAVFGDVIGYMDTSSTTSGGENKMPKTHFEQPQIDIGVFMSYLWDGVGAYRNNVPQVTYQTYPKDAFKCPSDGCPDPKKLQTTTETLQMGNNVNMKSQIYKSFKSIIEKIQRKEELSQSQINFIDSAGIPLIDLLNLAAVDKIQITEDSPYAAYIALQSFRTFMEKFIQEAEQGFKYIKNKKDFDEEQYQKFVEHGREMRQAINARLMLLNKDVEQLNNVASSIMSNLEQAFKANQLTISSGI